MMGNLQHVGLEFNLKASVIAMLVVKGLPPTEFVGTFEDLMKESHTESMLYGNCSIRIIELTTPNEKETK